MILISHVLPIRDEILSASHFWICGPNNKQRYSTNVQELFYFVLKTEALVGVLLFSKLNTMIFGYFHPQSGFLDDKNS